MALPTCTLGKVDSYHVVSRPLFLRPVSTQESKHRIGSDWTFSILYYPHRQTKKVENTSTLYPSGLQITGSTWNRKLVPKLVQFCSDLMLIFLRGNQPLGHVVAALIRITNMIMRSIMTMSPRIEIISLDCPTGHVIFGFY